MIDLRLLRALVVEAIQRCDMELDRHERVRHSRFSASPKPRRFVRHVKAGCPKRRRRRA